MSDITFDNLYGGLDTRPGIVTKNSKLLFMTEASNIDIIGQNVRRARGQVLKLQIPDVAILGIAKHEIDGLFYMRAICSDGKYYRVDPVNSIVLEAKNGLSENAKPYFFQGRDNNLICLTGTNDPFADDGITITDCGLFTQRNVYGTCGISHANKIFIAAGTRLYYSATYTLNDWLSEGDAGFLDFNGDITAINKFGSYIYVRTKRDIYILTGSNASNFGLELISSNGGFSKYSLVEYDKRVYAWDGGLYPIEDLSDVGQTRTHQDLSYKAHTTFENVDKTRLDEIIMVSYPNRKQLWIYLPIENEPGLSKALIANFINYNDTGGHISFYYREANPITCICEFEGNIYSGTADGKIYQEDRGNTFDGNIIKSEFWFSTLNLGVNSIKKCKKMDTIWNAMSENICTLMFRYDGDNYAPEEEPINIEVNDAYFELGESELDSTQVLAVSDKISELIILAGRFKQIQIGIKTENANEDFILDSFTFINVINIGRY